MEGENQLRGSCNNLAWAVVTVMEIKEVCFRGSRDRIWDEFNVEGNGKRGTQIFVQQQMSWDGRD